MKYTKHQLNKMKLEMAKLYKTDLPLETITQWIETMISLFDLTQPKDFIIVRAMIEQIRLIKDAEKQGWYL